MKDIIVPRCVYFMGAGASHASDFKLPLMQELSKIIFDRLGRESIVLSRFSHSEQNNIEDILTYIDCCIAQFSQPSNDHHVSEEICRLDLAKERHDIIDIIISELDHTGHNSIYKCSKYALLWDNIASCDSIITLNYDTIGEYTLSSLYGYAKNCNVQGNERGEVFYKPPIHLDNGINALIGSSVCGQYNISSSSMDKGYYLKLHGSIDWMSCNNTECSFRHEYSYSRISTRTSGDPRTHKIDRLSICPRCGRDRAPVIIPPAMIKAFDRYPRLAVIWRMAAEVLSRANEIIIIGYSFPMTDYWVRWLLRTSIYINLQNNHLKRVHVVDIGDNASRVERQLLATVPEPFIKEVDVKIYRGGMDEYLDWKRKNSQARTENKALLTVDDCF